MEKGSPVSSRASAAINVRSTSTMGATDLTMGLPLGLGVAATLAATGGPRGAAKRKASGVFPVLLSGLNSAAAAAAAAAVSSPTANSSSSSSKAGGLPVAVTSHPSNESELQIYRVLQRANLLSYYDTFIAQGGDDVQQLCEAGEGEFLEIMDLVGMASKPMHVRRLQKALQEWVQNPGVFQAPLVPLSSFSAPSAAAAVIRTSSSTTINPPPAAPVSSAASPSNIGPPAGSRPTAEPLSLIRSTAPFVATSSLAPSSSAAPLLSSTLFTTRRSVSPPSTSIVLDKATSSAPHSPSPVGSLISSGACKDNTNHSQSGGMPSPTYSQSGQDYPPLSSSPLQITPSLVESQIQRIADTAENLIKAMLLTVEPKQLKNNKKVSKEVEVVLALPDDDPRKMEDIRRLSAIYGRFDCKRKPEKPLTLHEVSVNEAAAQLCLKKPILLMRRDELFPLARQVVRDSGYQYSKGHSRSQFQAGYPSKVFGLGGNSNSGNEENSRDSSNGDGQKSIKRARYSESEDGIKKERLERIGEELRHLSDRMEEMKSAAGQARDANDVPALHAIGQQLEMMQSRQARLLQEQHHERSLRASRGHHGRMSTSSDPERPDTDEEDSQLSYSNPTSPNLHQHQHQHHHHSHQASQHAGSYVLSASGGQIIAVQNPALSMSGALPMRTSSTSPNSSHAPGPGGHQLHHDLHVTKSSADNSGLVNLLNLSRSREQIHHHQQQQNHHHNAIKTTIIHEDDDEMTFKQEPASPPPTTSNIHYRMTPPPTNGKI